MSSSSVCAPLCFSMSCSVDPPHLHSFPTRRSSDLGVWCRFWIHKQRYVGYLFVLLSLLFLALFVVYPIDRKSTRLNSSHLVISYAVFCLKKKNQKMSPENTRRKITTRENTNAQWTD